jgi:hypothetical protein
MTGIGEIKGAIEELRRGHIHLVFQEGNPRGRRAPSRLAVLRDGFVRAGRGRKESIKRIPLVGAVVKKLYHIFLVR